jgi:DnaJ-class molecular chaperone
MTLEEARELLGLERKATRREIRAAYRRAARRWHPDRAPAGAEAEYRGRMQQINAAYQRIGKFLEEYRYELIDTTTPADYQQWWMSRFYTGVWQPPPSSDQGGGEDD